MAIFLKLSSSIGSPPVLFGIDPSYTNSAPRVTDVLAQKPTLRVTYVVAHRGNRCPDTCQLFMISGSWHKGKRLRIWNLEGFARLTREKCAMEKHGF
jgi:hypothetical protein